MRAVAGAAAVPAAPLMVPEASHDQPEDIRQEIVNVRRVASAAIAAVPEVDVWVLVAAGPRGIFDSAVASLAPLGVRGADAELPVATSAIEHLSRVTQYPMFRGDQLSIDLSTLALQLRAVRGDVPVLPIHVPPGTDFDVLVSVGASIDAAVADASLTAGVVVAADLSAGLGERSPAYAIDGAGDWDRAVIDAVEAGDLRALRPLGPDEATRVRAGGWAPLSVLHGVCAASRLTPQLLAYGAPRGVGQLVARCVGGPDDEDAPFERSARGNEGVVPRTGDSRG